MLLLIGAGVLVLAVILLSLAWQRWSSDVEHGLVAFDVAPDGESIVFSSADGDLYLLQLRTKRVEQFTRTAEKETTPAFSPDGKAIAYCLVDDRDRRGEIHARARDGAYLRKLSDLSGLSDTNPSFSADGKRVAFVRAHLLRPYSMGGWKWDRWDVYVVNFDGTDLRRVTARNYYQIGTPPRFSSDGAAIVYSAGHVSAHGELVRSTFAAEVDGKRGLVDVTPGRGRRTRDRGLSV